MEFLTELEEVCRSIPTSSLDMPSTASVDDWSAESHQLVGGQEFHGNVVTPPVFRSELPALEPGSSFRRSPSLSWSSDSLQPNRVVGSASQPTQMGYVNSLDQDSGVAFRKRMLENS
jgi:hypothetical protein